MSTDSTMYWTVVLNEIACTTTVASGMSGMYETPEEAHAAVKARWGQGKEAAVVPLLVPKHNAAYRAGLLAGYEMVMTDLVMRSIFWRDLPRTFTCGWRTRRQRERRHE